MSEIEPKRRVLDRSKIPPGYRYQDIAAFELGFEPYHLWHLFLTYGDLPTRTSGERWLRDVPVLLSQFIHDVSANRYTETLEDTLRILEQYPAATDGDSPSKRDDPKFRVKVYGFSDNEPGPALIRLASGLSQTFPPALRQWFLLGQAVGRFFNCLTDSGFDNRFEIMREIEQAAAATDLNPYFRLLIRREDYLGEDEVDSPEYDELDPAYADVLIESLPS